MAKSRSRIAVMTALVILVLAGSAFMPEPANAEDPYNSYGSPFECGTYEAQIYGCGSGYYYGCDGFYGYSCGHGCSYGYGYGCYPNYACDPYYDDDDDYDCDYDCDGYYGHGYGYYCYSGYPGYLSIVASPGTISCGSTTTITVDIHQPAGYLSGVNVALATSVLGSVKPATIVPTVNGRAIFTFTAPQGYRGPVQLNASTEWEANSLTIQVDCAAPTNIGTAQRAPAVAIAAGGIQPPNTGDGGLR